ncbi:hypothetical protein E4P82_05585 [Candidatus Competibacter phosphatis]|uniref:Uncharacterized protein n=1 Tax=Candidatus Competibacter phosphatis TaxID=221280 RepID=A0ABX1TLD4_9GAMM|nr:hypothetical protein [Candidatus Competibacter phosphatis]NMQ18720.1 hypothetical protein [Candidatus Competibacter phosphatis]
MSNTHSIPSVASFDANPRCILPDAIIDPVSDELQAIENLAERLRGHAEGHVHANDPRTLDQLDLLACSIGIVRIAEGLGRRVESLREPYSRRNEIALELTQAEANSLKRIAAEWGVDEGIAVGRIVMEELQRRFGLSGGPSKAA